MIINFIYFENTAIHLFYYFISIVKTGLNLEYKSTILIEENLILQTAISYLCSTNLTKFLELILTLPDIDVNKADNEKNTPLHFAAQAGKCLAVGMLN